MPYFFYKLIPPRPTFAQDMNDAERAIMNEHIAYLNALYDEGVAILFGPVFDPKGAWGLGVFETASEEEARKIGENDPAVKSGLNTVEILPVMLGRVRPK